MSEPAGRPSLLRTVLVLAATTAAILGGIWVVNTKLTDDGVSEVTLTGDTAGPAPAVGEAAPLFTAVDITGHTVDLAALQGEPVWLVFGATWCTNCRAETADIEAVASAFSGEVAVVGVYVGESADTVADYAARLGLTYTQVADPATELGSAYKVMGIPSHVFIDADGVIRDVRVGGLSEAAATGVVESLRGSA
jgi:peroxiredoxin